MLTFKLLEWSDEARDGLKDTYNGPEHEQRFKTGVESGRMRLWRVGGHSYAITEADGDTLIVWAYQGKEVLKFAVAIGQAAQQVGFTKVQFFTKHDWFVRIMKPLNPVADPDVDGVYTVHLYSEVS